MPFTTRLLAIAAGLLTALVWVLPAASAELIMLEQPGCVWCKRWNEEIGSAYPKTAEGARAPLRRVDITGAWPEDLDKVAKERLTPTFILVSDGVEIDRLRGYPGEHFFWPLLAAMLEKLPEKIN
ncbi:transcriptional regulator [Roseibium sediminicola]|uniref:Transcriptional regulator n=1 Tax=Roseibium sediminicola TaxID=2933272 RepID=A0ABT0H102_9HYPH|nr:transcriptional regulator [Roseibium sp. CAU 1639]MCK7615349.1 transcriptional regulator [Roseibium sp. CAU 1639]